MPRRRVVTIAVLAALVAVPGCHHDAGAGASAGPAADGGHRDAGDVVLASHLPARDDATGDLPAIEQRGVLRVIIPGTREDFLPRQGTPTSYDRSLARDFARRFHLKIRFVLVPDHARLLSALDAGKGDVVVARLAVTPLRSKVVDFTRPVATVDEMVVDAKDDPHPPRSLADLKGREIDVRKSSSYYETLERLKVPGLTVKPANERLDAEQLAYRVGRHQLPLTVVDSDILAAIETYNDEVTGRFPIAEGDHIAWAIRKHSPKLKAALDAFLIEKALTAHTRKIFKGDLAGIKKRGVLRVITRNNPVTYFLYRGRQLGFDFELARLAAKALGVRLEMVVPPSRDRLIPWLLEGRGDVIAASLTVLPRRAKRVAFSAPYLHVEEMLMGRKGGPQVETLQGLKGRTIVVRRSSSYWTTLEGLEKKVGPFTVKPAPEEDETEELIDEVAKRKIPFTVADSDIALVELTWRDDVAAELALTAPDEKPGAWKDLTRGSKAIAFAVRPSSKHLLAWLDAFVSRTYRGVAYNVARKRYFHDRKAIDRVKTGRVGVGGHLSPYDALLKKYSARYGLDWRLMAATAFQESRFDPHAKSWVGALGLFQVMPQTAHALGFDHPERPAEGVAAGIEYIHQLIGRIDPTLPLRVRVRMALAAYNAGLGHVRDARRLADRLGLDPDKWFGNVSKAMLLLEKPRYYRHARYGYCRGSEPVAYVSQIQNRYDNYVKIVKQQ